MTKTRGARILVLALLGVALATPVVVCACLASVPDPMPGASCHTPPAAAWTAGCCCVASTSGEVDGDQAALPTLRAATAATTPVVDRFGTSLVAPDPMLAPVPGAPPRHTVPLRL